MTGPIRDTTGERIQDAFVESPTRANKTAVETFSSFPPSFNADIAAIVDDVHTSLLVALNQPNFSETVWYDKNNPSLFYVRTSGNDEFGDGYVIFKDAAGNPATPVLANLVQSTNENATHVASLSAGAGVHAAENTLVGGVYNLTPVTLTDGTQSELNLDNKGNLKVSVENTVPTINIGGVDVNNFPAVQLVAGTLPSVTGNDSDGLLAGNAKQEDFLKVGGYDLGSNEYRIAKFSGDNLQVQDQNSNSSLSSLVSLQSTSNTALNSIDAKSKASTSFSRTINTPATNTDFLSGVVSPTAWYDVQTGGYSFGTVSLMGTLATGTIVLEGTNDNTSATGMVIPMRIGNTISVAPVITAVAIPIATTNYEFSIKYRYIRLRIVTASTGNVTAKFYLTPNVSENDHVYVNAGSIAISSGTVTTVTTVGNIAAITPSISAGGFSSHHTLVCAASTNATLVKSTASMIGSISVSNSDVNTFYLKLFNIATAPVVGTTVPAYVYMIPKNTTYNIPIPSYGMRFDAGLSYSTTVNAATADTTAIAAGQAVVNINYV